MRKRIYYWLLNERFEGRSVENRVSPGQKPWWFVYMADTERKLSLKVIRDITFLIILKAVCVFAKLPIQISITVEKSFTNSRFFSFRFCSNKINPNASFIYLLNRVVTNNILINTHSNRAHITVSNHLRFLTINPNNVLIWQKRNETRFNVCHKNDHTDRCDGPPVANYTY